MENISIEPLEVMTDIDTLFHLHKEDFILIFSTLATIAMRMRDSNDLPEVEF
jgi:hypothetical protein